MDVKSTLAGNPKLGVGVLFLWVGLAVPFRGPAVVRWGLALIVSLAIGWGALALRPYVSTTRPANAPPAGAAR